MSRKEQEFINMGHGFNLILGNINYVTHTYLLVCKGLFLDKEEKQGSEKKERVKQDKEEKHGGEKIGTI